MNVRKTKLPGVLLIDPQRFSMIFRVLTLKHITLAFTKSNVALIKISFKMIFRLHLKGVLRGIHGDDKTWKLVSCIHGTFYFVVVNNDPQSKFFKQWEHFTFKAQQNRLQVLAACTDVWKRPSGNAGDIAIFRYKPDHRM